MDGFRIDGPADFSAQDKTQPISQTLACKTVEIIPLSEVSDVYNVSTGHDPSEFIIRKARNAVTMYFSSPVRDHIVKVSCSV